jgi:hypothetical protein
MVGIREELNYRGFISVRGEKYLNLGSSIVISSLFFAMSHFSYYVRLPISQLLPNIIPALIWSIASFIVGSVSAVFILKHRMLWPIIIAHMFNNIISGTVLWLYSTYGLSFWFIVRFIYFPLLGISLLLGIIFFKEVKSGLKDYYTAFKDYKNKVTDKSARKSAIVLDIFFALILWVLSIFIGF